MMEPRMKEPGERRAVVEGRPKHDALLAWGHEGAVFTDVGCGGWI